MGAPDGSCFQYKGNGAAMSHIFLLNNPHFQKEFQKMMARRQTLFSFSLHFAPILSKLSVDNMSKKRRDSPASLWKEAKLHKKSQPILCIMPHFVRHVTIKLKFLYISRA